MPGVFFESKLPLYCDHTVKNKFRLFEGAQSPCHVILKLDNQLLDNAH